MGRRDGCVDGALLRHRHWIRGGSGRAGYECLLVDLDRGRRSQRLDCGSRAWRQGSPRPEAGSTPGRGSAPAFARDSFLRAADDPQLQSRGCQPHHGRHSMADRRRLGRARPSRALQERRGTGGDRGVAPAFASAKALDKSQRAQKLERAGPGRLRRCRSLGHRNPQKEGRSGRKGTSGRGRGG